MIETVLRNAVGNQESIVVGLGEMKIIRSTEAILSCIGIGSCIAVCVHDYLSKVGGMGHIVLPHCDGNPGNNLARYADTAVPLLIEEMIKQGGSRSRLVIKIAGGAQMSLAPGLKNTFKTGERNLEEVKAALDKEGLKLVSADVGGNKGRTVRLYLGTGIVTVKTAGGEVREI
jgi:chemotaxis protein CheD